MSENNKQDENDEKKEIKGEIEILSGLKNYECKAFVWKKNLQPQMTPVTFNGK